MHYVTCEMYPRNLSFEPVKCIQEILVLHSRPAAVAGPALSSWRNCGLMITTTSGAVSGDGTGIVAAPGFGIRAPVQEIIYVYTK